MDIASIHKEVQIDADPDAVWDAVRGFGALHTRLVRGFVVDTKLDRESRIVIFANGVVQREPLVDCDYGLRRLVYSAVDSPMGATHYNASVQVFADGEAGSRVVWIVDVLPHTLRELLGDAMDRGASAMKRTLEAGTQPSRRAQRRLAESHGRSGDKLRRMVAGHPLCRQG